MNSDYPGFISRKSRLYRRVLRWEDHSPNLIRYWLYAVPYSDFNWKGSSNMWSTWGHSWFFFYRLFHRSHQHLLHSQERGPVGAVLMIHCMQHIYLVPLQGVLVIDLYHTLEKNPPYGWFFGPPLVGCSHKYVCFEDIWCRPFKTKVNMQLVSVFLKYHFDILALHTKRKWCGQMGPTPCHLQSRVVSACQNLRPVAPFFFLVKVPFLLIYYYYFFNTENGVAI